MSTAFAPPFEAFVAPARIRAQIWRLLLGLILSGIVYVGWSAGVLAAAWWLLDGSDPRIWMGNVARAQTPRDTFILLSTFPGMAMGPIIAARLLHKRSARSLFGRAPIVLRHFVVAACVVAIVYSVSIGLWFLRFDAELNLDPTLWLALLPLSLFALLIQTGAEELLFRGYLQQQLAARFAAPLIWLILPSLAFGAAHYDPATAGGNVWLIVAATTLFGLVAADLTRATGSIGAAWGFHFANNTAALLVLATKGTIPGLALWLTPYSADQTEGMTGLVLADLAALILAWLLVRRLLQR